jgi:hypothetical protein
MGFFGFFWHSPNKHLVRLGDDLGFCGKTLVFKRENNARALISKIRIQRFAQLAA